MKSKKCYYNNIYKAKKIATKGISGNFLSKNRKSILLRSVVEELRKELYSYTLS